METSFAERLGRHGIVLPEPAAAAANYLPFVRHGDILYVSGQLPMRDGTVAVRGKVGGEVSLDEAREAARLCAVNILAQASAALEGDIARLVRVLRITGYVASTPGFTEQHLVLNGASDLIAEALGEAGRHARVAIGVPSLPLDAAVEIESLIAVR